MSVKVQLTTSFDLFLSIVDSLLDDFRGLSSSFFESLFKCLDAGGIDKDKVTVDIIIVDLFSPLDIDIHDANLSKEAATFPLFMISMSFPLCVP